MEMGGTHDLAVLWEMNKKSGSLAPSKSQKEKLDHADDGDYMGREAIKARTPQNRTNINSFMEVYAQSTIGLDCQEININMI